MSSILIVWGKNRTLAEILRMRLEREGHAAIVGGEETVSGKFLNHNLGQRIIDQMNQASHAIVLAQWPPENDTEATDLSFRPNLMFEWGFLLARFQHQPTLHVFLIGISRQQLPSDLCGFYTHEVQHKANTEDLAEAILAIFLRDVRSESADPMRPFIDWSGWLYQLKAFQGSDNTIALSLLHGIQPAFYRGELEVVHQLSAELVIRFGASRQLMDACAVTNAVCEYYIATKVNNAEPDRGRMYQVLNMLRMKTPSRCETDVALWTHIIRLDFLGLICRRLAEANASLQDQKASDFLTESRDSFSKSLELVNSIPMDRRCGCWHLWLGYLSRNLGRVCSTLEEEDLGRKYLEQARECHREALRSLSAARIPEIIQVQLSMEIILVELDLAKYDHALSSDSGKFLMKQAIRILLDTPRFEVWRRTLAQASSLAQGLHLTEEFAELQRLHNGRS